VHVVPTPHLVSSLAPQKHRPVSASQRSTLDDVHVASELHLQRSESQVSPRPCCTQSASVVHSTQYGASQLGSKLGHGGWLPPQHGPATQVFEHGVYVLQVGPEKFRLQTHSFVVGSQIPLPEQ